MINYWKKILKKISELSNILHIDAKFENDLTNVVDQRNDLGMKINKIFENESTK